MLPFAMVFCNSFLRLPVIVFLLFFFICEIFSQFLEIWLLGLFEPICLFQNRDLSLIHRYFSISPSLITPLQLLCLEKLLVKKFRIFWSVSNSFISGVFYMRNNLGGKGTFSQCYSKCEDFHQQLLREFSGLSHKGSAVLSPICAPTIRCLSH